ncbi:MAG: hypothetical protein M1114_06590 [Candidatus Dependentiae bacterium]|nr:hypothetical protein [Candidatus Dependentiae bacterium]
MVKQTIKFLCLITSAYLFATDKPETDTYVRQVKKTNHKIISILIDIAGKNICDIAGGNQTLFSVPLNKVKDDIEEKTTVPVLETKDVISISSAVIKQIAISEQETLKLLAQECGREAVKTYIGDKVYSICRSKGKDLKTVAEEKLPESIKNTINEITKEPVVSAILQTTWPIILQCAISLTLDTIDNKLFSNDTKRKP